MKKILFLFLGLVQLVVIAQHDIYFGGQMDLGIVGKTSFDNGTLDKKNLSPHLGGMLFVNWRLFDVVALELGIGQHWNNSRFKDPVFEQENEGFSIEMNNKNYYWNYYTSLSGLLRIGSTDSYLYGKLAYSINIYGEKTVANAKPFAISRLDIDQTINSTTSYVESNQSLIPEIGFEQKLSNRSLISAGIKMNVGLTDALSGAYSITDNTSGEVAIDNFSSLGNLTAITFRYSVLLHHIPKKERVKRITKQIQNQRIDTVSAQPKMERPTEIANRKLVVTQKMKVHSSKVTIFIWDHQTVDGDRVSLNLNGKWILKDYTLQKNKYSFEIELVEGVNTFVLHALNLGKYKPNTAALIVKEGIKSHKVILESDLNESGTLEINYKKKKE